MDTNPATGLPMIGGHDTRGNSYGSNNNFHNNYSLNRKETKEESNLNDIGAYIMLVLGSGFLVYAYRLEIVQFFGF